MRTEAQKESRRKYEASEKGKAAKKRHDANYVASGGRAKTEARRESKPLSEARKQARYRWRKANPEYYAANRAIRRAAERNVSEFDLFVLIEARFLAKARNEIFGFDWHVDHVIPVSKGGKSTFDNVQVVPASWNRSKSNKHSKRMLG